MFSERLKLLRKMHGITQTQFAKEFNISQGTVGMWETQKRAPDFETAVRIADYFDVTTDYLLGRDEKKPTPKDGDGLSEKQRMVYERLAKLTPENLEIAIGQLDVLLTLQEKREKN